MKRTITISNSVAQALELGNLNAEQILRNALNIEQGDFITVEGVNFPEGTSFMAWYKGRPYWGHIKRGFLEVREQQFTSVSSAAGSITHRPTNGWDFWQCKLPGKKDFVPIKDLRNNLRGTH